MHKYHCKAYAMIMASAQRSGLHLLKPFKMAHVQGLRGMFRGMFRGCKPLVSTLAGNMVIVHFDDRSL
jgi:hypothetical protein